MTVKDVKKFLNEDTCFFSRRPNDLLEHIYPRKIARNDRLPYKFAYARTALKYGLTAFGFKPGDILLVPDFNCESLLEPLDKTGVEPCYYPVDRALVPDWEQLSRMVTGATKALLIVHYFGQPQSISDCIAFCRQHNLILIEDNAHGYGGTVDGQLLGTFGEIGISAPRKSFPIINGALLYMTDQLALDLDALQLKPTSGSPLMQRCKQTLKKNPVVNTVLKWRKDFIALKRRSEQPPQYGSQDGFRDPPIDQDYGMDQYIADFLANQNIVQIREKRQTIYRLWHQWAEHQELIPVFASLAPGALPLVFPAYAQSPDDSREWYERGHRIGIDIHSWPTLPRTIVEQNNSAMRLWERMICFPIHQDMDFKLLEARLAHL